MKLPLCQAEKFLVLHIGVFMPGLSKRLVYKRKYLGQIF